MSAQARPRSRSRSPGRGGEHQQSRSRSPDRSKHAAVAVNGGGGGGGSAKMDSAVRQMSGASPLKKRNLADATLADGKLSDAKLPDTKGCEAEGEGDGDTQMADGGGVGSDPSGMRALPDMIVVQMLSTEGEPPEVYGLPVAALTKEVHVWLRGDTWTQCLDDQKVMDKARKDKNQQLQDELRKKASARDKTDKAARSAYETNRVELHHHFNDGHVIMLNGAKLYTPENKPVGKFAGALLFRDRN